MGEASLEVLPLPLDCQGIPAFVWMEPCPALHVFAYSLPPDSWQVQSSKKDREDPLPCVCPKSHLTSGLRTIAELLNTGAVCGVPTDTVYALAASCKHPQAIEKVYRIKVGIQGCHLVTWLCVLPVSSCRSRKGSPWFQVVPRLRR